MSSILNPICRGVVGYVYKFDPALGDTVVGGQHIGHQVDSVECISGARLNRSDIDEGHDGWRDAG